MQSTDGAAEAALIRRKPLPTTSSFVVKDLQSSPDLGVYDGVDATSHITERTINRARHQRPFWLKRKVLGSLLFLLTILWVTLVVLWRYTVDHEGLGLSVTTNHYAWTYGPTAILVFVVSFWRQVDYQCKATTPWYEMHKGTVMASRSILLDYLWPLQINSLWQAARNHHITVVVSILGFVLLKLLVVISTALLIRLPTQLSKAVPVMIEAAFANSTFWNDISYPIINSLDAVSFPNFPIDVVLTYVSSVQGLPTDGIGIIKNNATLQPFLNASSIEGVDSISTQAIAFFPNVVCERATLLHWESYNSSLSWDLDSSSCPVRHTSQIGVPGSSYNQSQSTSANSCIKYMPNGTDFLGNADTLCDHGSDIIYKWSRVNCSAYHESDGKTDSSGNSWSLVPTSPDVYGYAFTVVNFTNKLSETGWYHHDLISSTAVICRMRYNLSEAEIQYKPSTNETVIKSIGQISNPDTIQGLTNLQLSEMVFSSPSGEYHHSDRSWSIYPIESLLGLTLSKNDTFFDIEKLTYATETFFGTMASVIVGKMYMKPSETEMQGHAEYMEDRLHFSVVSTWTMFTLLLVLSILVALLLWTTRNARLVPYSDTVASHAAILTHSPQMQELLAGKGTSAEEGLMQTFKNTEVSMDYDNDLRIFASRTSTSGEGAVSINQTFRWIPFLGRKCFKSRTDIPKTKDIRWVPYLGRKHAISLTISLPVMAICTLEILNQSSAHHEGVVDITNESSALFYVIRYSTTIAALTIATLYSSLDFTIAAFAPLVTLRSKTRSASRSILLTLLGSPPPIALYESIKARNFGAAAANLSAVCGSILSIIVSGLWVLDLSVPREMTISAHLGTSWTLNWSQSAINDTGPDGIQAHDIVANIIAKTAELPPNIWNDLVLPNVSFISSQTTTSNSLQSQMNYTITVPALRPRLDCDVVPDDQKTIMDFEGAPNISAHYEFPNGCFVGSYGNSSDWDWNLILSNEAQIPTSGYGGEVKNTWATTNKNRNLFNNPSGCPSILASIFNVEVGPWQPDQYAVLFCYQRLEQVYTKVTFVGDPTRFEISTEHSPVPDQSRITLLENKTLGVDSFDFPSGQYLTHTKCNASISSNSDYDYAINDLVYCPGGIPLDELIFPNASINVNAFVEGVQNLYKQYMVIAIDRLLKSSATGEDATKDLEASMITYQHRLKISNGSKLALQVLLAAMTILGIAAYLLVDLRETLPAPPTSIAALMALFAESEMCDPKSGVFVSGSTRMNKKELEQSLRGWQFSIGWWKTPGGKVNEQNEGVLDVSQKAPVVKSTDVATKRFGVDVGTADTRGLTLSQTSRGAIRGRWAHIFRKQEA